MNVTYISTGNQMVSLPAIKEETAGIQDITFLHMGYKGLIDICGDEIKPLMQPFIKAQGAEVGFDGLTWNRIGNWIPEFSLEAGSISLKGVIIAPVEERGFLLRLKAVNISSSKIDIAYGLCGRWAASLHCVNESKPLGGEKHCYRSSWNNGIAFDMRCGTPMFAFAPVMDKKCECSYEMSEKGVDFRMSRAETVEPGESCELTFFWGIGFEEVAAVTSAKQMLRQGFVYEFDHTLSWIAAHTLDFKDEKLSRLYNINLLFCIFFSTGITLDTEELVIVTSRSPRYYVSAAYWDRDSLLWSFPAILDIDRVLARQMLMYVFTRQGKNLGVHSRYIDGTVLEPGFELDELMAPAVALERYCVETNDGGILDEPCVRAGIRKILGELSKHRSPSDELYDTFLQPTDDERVYKYNTYDNVMVWKALKAIAALYPEYKELEQKADDIKAAIERHCVKEKDGKRFYAWSVDLEGHYDIYDEPPGSLQLLAYFGFCPASDETYKNTVEMIRSPGYRYSFSHSRFAETGCPHAPHPWILSVSNSLLCGRIAHCADFLRNVKMDNFTACESVDENTGECATGAAFATCAGFLCHAMKECRERLNKINEK